MTSLTITVSDELKNELKSFSWVNWSEIAREEITKKLIFEYYMKHGKITNEQWDFCKKIDWHPVDELPLQPKVKQLLQKDFGKSEKFSRAQDIFK